MRDGAPLLEGRRADLLKLKNAILAHRKDYEAAINADFGNRSVHETDIMEIMPTTQGIDSPWNFPAGLFLMPLATAIAAGNRTMVKPSEYTPRTSELMASMLREIFPEEQVAVVTGGSDVGSAFSALPFDHLVFTGSTDVGRAVMRAASENPHPPPPYNRAKPPLLPASSNCCLFIHDSECLNG